MVLLPTIMYAQTTTILRGVIKDTKKQAIEGVNIQFNSFGTTSDKNGNYRHTNSFKPKNHNYPTVILPIYSFTKRDYSNPVKI